MNGAPIAVVEKTTTDVLKLKELDETVVKFHCGDREWERFGGRAHDDFLACLLRVARDDDRVEETQSPAEEAEVKNWRRRKGERELGRKGEMGEKEDEKRRKQHHARGLPLPNRKRNNPNNRSSSNRSDALAVTRTDATVMGNEALYDNVHRVDSSSPSSSSLVQ